MSLSPSSSHPPYRFTGDHHFDSEPRPSLADLNDPIARLEAGLYDRPELLEGRHHSRSPTVAQADPKNSSRSFGAVGEMEKIFILADNDASLLVCIPADFRAGRLG
jgi:hypothetical protein